MAALDVHRVKACFLGKLGGFTELDLQSLQVVVADNTGIIRRAVLLQNRVAVGDHRGGLVAGVGVPPAVVRLHDQVRRKAVRLDAGFLDGGGHFFEFVQRVAGQQQLRLGGTPFLDNGDGFKPDDGAAADGLVDIAAHGVGGGCALRRGVGTLHRRDAQPVREGDVAHLQRVGKAVGVQGEGQADAQLCGFLLDFLQRFIVEFFVWHSFSPCS